MRLITLVALIGCFTAFSASAIKPTLANPASVNCAKMGGKPEIRKTSNQDQVGVCVWSGTKDSECGEWALFRGECKKGECAKWHTSYDAQGKLISKCAEKL